MTALSFRPTAFTLSEAASDIGDVYLGIVAGLPSLGFADAKNEGDHVFASNNGYLLDVFYLLNEGRSFWQVLAIAGDVEATNDEFLDEVQAMISGGSFL